MTAILATDPDALKAAARAQWDQAAAGWNGHGPMIRNWLADVTAAMMDMAGLRPGHRVLDVAAGAGDQTLDLAARVGPKGFVVATDLSPGILEHARSNVERAGLTNVETRLSDGERPVAEEATFDAAICRLGLMLFPNPLNGLISMHRALRPGGMACTLVFSTPQANPCIAILMQTALSHAGLPPADPFRPSSLFSLGRPGHIDDLFRRAGFEDVATTRLPAPFSLPSAKAYLGFIRSSASPVLQILARLDQAAQAAAFEEMERRLRMFDTADGWTGPNELLLTAGRR
jgi:ubiquinone/menaquinone biosynthesis C-methylase UbiE